MFINKGGYYNDINVKLVSKKVHLYVSMATLRVTPKKTAISWSDIDKTSSPKEKEVLLVIPVPMQIRLVG